MKKFTLGIVLSIVFLLTGALQAQISTFPYQEGFEAGAGGWASDAGANDSWVLGTPAKVVIVGASEGTNAWVTSLAGTYPANQLSAVESPVFDFSALAGDPTITMDVWWESELSWDGTVLQSSIDAGTSWQDVGALGDPDNWYTDGTINALPGSEDGWSGRNGTGSGGYVEAEHLLDGLAGEAAVTLRVLFGSDASGQDDGFAFDNVRITTQVGDAPVIACPADLIIDTTAGMCSGVANWATPVAIDTEDGPITPVQTMGPASGSALPTGVTIIEYTATDSDGNMTPCQFTVTVVDNEAPVAVCQDLALDLDASGMATITVADLDNGSSDNCGIVSSTMTIGAGGPATLNVGFASNNGAAGNMFDVMAINPITINSFDINANDIAGESHDYEVYYKVGTWVGSETTSGDWTLVASPTGIITAGVNVPTPLNLALGINVAAGDTVAFYITATDGSTLAYTGATGTTGTGNLWASDANLEFYEGAGKGYPFGSTFAPRVFNGNIQYEAGPQVFSGTFDCSNIGSNVINVTHTDAQGNSTSCSSTVTITDNTAPDIVCIGQPATVTDSTTDAPALAIPDSDAAGVDTIITIADDFSITDLDVDLDITHTWVGDLIVTLTSPAGTSVVLVDRMGVPATSTVGCSSNDILITIDDEATDPIEDECEPGPPAASGSFVGNGALSAFDGESTMGDWVLNVSDNAGGDTGIINSWGLSYSHDMSGTPLEVVLDANGNASINAADLLLSVNEGCGYSVTVGSAPVPTTLSTPLTGGNGNFGNMFDVNALTDITVDSFDVHGDVGLTFDVNVWVKTGTHVGFEADASAWTLLDTAVGIVSNGDGVVTPLNLTLGYTIPAGETHAFFVSPIGGGFNYHNGTAVGAIAGADANLELLEGSAVDEAFSGTVFAPRVFEGNIIYSAGGGVSSTVDFDCSNLGDNLVEVTVTDDSGNVSTCTATVTVLDETAPILVCSSDATIELGPDGTAVVDPMALLAVMPTTYNVMTISSDNQSGLEGFTDLTVPVTEAATITFDWSYSTADGADFDGFGYLLNGVYTELIDPLGATNQTGSASVAVAIGDVFGFRSQSDDGLFGGCSTVVSNFMPGFTGQFDPANWTETLTNSDGSAEFIEIPGGPLSFDACGITVLAVDITEVSCDDIGTPLTITVFASDASGNIASCTSTVTVVDALGPVVTCPADQTQDPGAGNLFYEVPDYFATGEATAEDNCTDPVTIFSQDPAAGTLLPDGVYPVTISAEDEYGNVGSCTFTLTVESVLGVEDNTLDIAIAMYPNPAQEQVTISNNSNIQLEKATIYDLNGKMVNQVNLSNMQGEKVIDISALASGVYVVQIISDQSSTVKRLIKE
ncbi:HYR domain-containing protein [Ulvibacter litoralis]|uniref:Por secretion system C-terminal sorting domain-containing protein n=1 Tax=Ulvibacter litoralis TaxID=227084 RepID=A0A1G7J150_9FLAO|nr:HYR domain-containing protein [Ulvibacter litoralis]SDF18249.1 Por secretion system C-terminal sorting domain-containing protein [Ulvibacter litoralis]